ncbi:hypothetical protein [Paraburkholderia sp. BL25I1N1]|uniref:hypothetical protein n=1 Tax=Paraburkholderia sp. BL25I1N1 TaxID=1938804 RepID=UPI000D4347A2|nr:hypothetical protein [Paraburkholderia sp. BL25I1N1]PRX95819.1 hypothetical protein B0G73_13227 [Paraburkholderia sp. BL25I1N1]
MQAQSAQVGSKTADSSSEALAKKRSKRRSGDVINLGRDGVEAKTAAVQEQLRPFLIQGR